MNYATVVTFSLKNASSDDYDCIYSQLAKAGLSHEITGKKTHRLPETTVYGEFDGDNVDDVKREVSQAVDKAFATCKLSGVYFIVVGGANHGWQISYPKN